MKRSIALIVIVGCQSAVVVAPVVTPPLSKVATKEEAHAPSASISSMPEIPVDSASVSIAEETPPAPPPQPVCTPQAAFEFLMRKSYVPVKTKKKEFDQALEWRTKTYGYVKGWGDKSWSAERAKDHVTNVSVFGVDVTVHEKIVPALRCVEAEIAKSCSATPYTPAALAGFREKNTYRGGEVTNHLWGIALDVDPKLNPCCGCGKKTKSNALCKKKVKDEFERMSMPSCWVDAFEKYGFYWLGHDVLRDTMHFEFLADPEKVMMTPGTASSVSIAE